MNWNSLMRQHQKNQLPLYVFVSVLFVMGVAFGAVMVNALSLEQREDLARFFSGFFHVIGEGDMLDKNVTFHKVFNMHMKWILLIWIFGLSVIGLPLVLLLDFLKGVLVGFTVGYLVSQHAWKGMLFALVSVVPQNAVIIPALIVCSVSAISFSVQLVKNRLMRRGGSVYQPFMNFSLLTLAMAFVMLGISLFEAFLSPQWMKWAASMFIS